MKLRFLCFITVIACAVCTVFAVSPRKGYYNYPAMLEKGAADLRAYLAEHPEAHADTLRARMLDRLGWEPIKGGAALKSKRTRRLPATKVYEIGKKSSLVFGFTEYNPWNRCDTAYANASAVALTEDGICATNFHVVADVVLQGALNYGQGRDKMRFVMDSEGYFYPVLEVLRVDPINDFAIFRVDTRGRKLTPASIGDDLAPGENVYVLANPKGAHFHFTGGIVSNCTEKVNPKSGRAKHILEITADYAGGASGGPVYDDRGNLVALVSSTDAVYGNQREMKNFQMSYKQTVPVFLIKECFTK